MDETSAAATHDLLLALAGQVDDDLLSWARELVAVDEARHALELLTASLVAERVELPGPTRTALVAVGRSVRTELDADAALPPDRPAADTPHRFDGGPADQVGDALRALPARLLVDCQVSLARRLTPAGSASGPLPHPVVLVEVAAGARDRDVLAYQLADALDRAGVRASVEVLTAGSDLPAYHAEALRRAQPVRTGERADSSWSNGPSNASADPARPGATAVTPSVADRAAADDPLETGPRAAASSASPSSASSSTASSSTGSSSTGVSSTGSSSAHEPASGGLAGPQRSTAPPRPVPVRPAGRATPSEPPAPTDPFDDRELGDVPELSERELPGPRPEPRRLPEPAPRPVAHPGASQVNPTPTGARPSPGQAGSSRSGPTPYREGAAASNVRSIVGPGGSAGEQRPDEPRPHPGRDELPAPVELPHDRSSEPKPVGEELTQLVPPRHRYLIERSDPDDVDPAGGRPAAPAPTGAGTTEPLAVRSTADRDRGRPLDPEDELAALSPHELLRPESVARLSASGRELLARLQAEMGVGPTLGPRAGGLTANGGGNGHSGGLQGGPNGGNGTGPHRRVDPPDLAG